ncbi:hypothetical protein OEZ86_001119 [Tetradesmus obliquus]|nr:hypothetical protein OEZ86_001119 [Tetradesmus obliquus]
MNYAASADNDASRSPFPQGYVSARIHHVLLTGLDQGTTYYYQVAASPAGTWSAQLSFTTLARKAAFPFRIGYMGDLGNTLNASVTVERMISSKPKMVSNLGDLA